LRIARIAASSNKKIIGTVINRVKREGHELTKKEIEEILEYPVLAEIPEDKNMAEAIAAKTPIVEYNPNSPAAIEFRRLAHYLTGKKFEQKKEKKIYSLIHRLARWLGR
jgi:MinD-like ATPase involved in chromosome partitioning or flagellar assembly